MRPILFVCNIWLDTYHIVVKIDGVCRLVEIVHASQRDPVFDLDRSLVVHIVSLLVQVERDLLLCILGVTFLFLLLLVHRAFLRVRVLGLVLLSQMVVRVRRAFDWVRYIVALELVAVLGVTHLLQKNVRVLVSPLGSPGHLHVILRASRDVRVVWLVVILKEFDILDVICDSGSWTFELADFRGERLSLLIIVCLLLLYLLDGLCKVGVLAIYALRCLRVLREGTKDPTFIFNTH